MRSHRSCGHRIVGKQARAGYDAHVAVVSGCHGLRTASRAGNAPVSWARGVAQAQLEPSPQPSAASKCGTACPPSQRFAASCSSTLRNASSRELSSSTPLRCWYTACLTSGTVCQGSDARCLHRACSASVKEVHPGVLVVTVLAIAVRTARAEDGALFRASSDVISGSAEEGVLGHTGLLYEWCRCTLDHAWSM
jgi:hypothetical protein